MFSSIAARFVQAYVFLILEANIAVQSIPLQCINMKLTSIQVLRAIAALMVLFSHLMFAIEYAGIPFPLYHIGSMNEMGIAGVVLFFGISGFIITYIGRKFAGDPRRSVTFLVRRILRIYPIYLILTVFAILLWKFGVGFRSTDVTPSYLIKSLLCFPMKRHPIIDQGWSLPFELYFYAIFSLGILLFSNFKRLVLACGAWFILAIGASKLLPNYEALEFLGNIHVVSFLVGSIFAVLYSKGKFHESGRIASILYIVSAGAFIVIYMVLPKPGIPYLIKCAPLYLVLAAALYSPNLKGKFASFLSKIGDASYSIYLTHGFFTMLLPRILQHLGPIQKLNPMMILIPTLIAIVSCGYLFWWTIENPIQEFVHQKLKGNPAPR